MKWIVIILLVKSCWKMFFIFIIFTRFDYKISESQLNYPNQDLSKPFLKTETHPKQYLIILKIMSENRWLVLKNNVAFKTRTILSIRIAARNLYKIQQKCKEICIYLEDLKYPF